MDNANHLGKERERETLEKALANIQTWILTVQVGIFMAESTNDQTSHWRMKAAPSELFLSGSEYITSFLVGFWYHVQLTYNYYRTVIASLAEV